MLKNLLPVKVIKRGILTVPFYMDLMVKRILITAKNIQMIIYRENNLFFLTLLCS